MKKILIFLLVAAALAVAWFVFKKSAPAAVEEEKKPAAKVETATLKQQVITQSLEVFGLVGSAPSSEQTLSATFDSVLRKINITPGARVAAGDVLMEVEPSHDAKLLLDSSRSALVLATKALAATQERYDLRLANSQDLLTAQQAEQDARQKSASLDARGLGGAGKILAPVTGVVSKLDLTTGALAVTGTPLVTIASDEHLEVRLGVEAGDLAQVAPGQAVTLVSSHRPDAGTVVSAVRIAGGSLDAVTGAAEVRVPVPPGAPLLLGEHVTASIEVKKKEALVAPRSAVLPDDDKQVIYTVKAGKAVRHEVTLGIAAGDLVEVSGKDLLDGDVVVTLGNYELADGMAIQSAEKEAGDSAEKNKPAAGEKPGEKAPAAKEAKP